MTFSGVRSCFYWPIFAAASILALFAHEALASPHGEFDLDQFISERQEAERRAGLTSEERGWFWGFIEELRESEEDEEQLRKILTQQDEPDEKPEEEIDCSDPDKWHVSCGFSDPGNDFDFQALQRDQLIRHAVMNPENSEAVRAVQKYMRWVVDQALLKARMWEWNMMQDQSLNPFIASPISSFGIRVATRHKRDARTTVAEEIKEQGGFLVYFSRDTCTYCHTVTRSYRQLVRLIPIEIYNVPLDGVCIPDFPGECYVDELGIEGARHLGIEAVPDLWLYLPEDELWFRVSSGMEAAETIATRIDMFFTAVVKAVKQGLEATATGGVPVDFSRDMFETSRGALGRGLE